MAEAVCVNDVGGSNGAGRGDALVVSVRVEGGRGLANEMVDRLCDDMENVVNGCGIFVYVCWWR